MYGRVVTTRSSASRTVARPQQALRSINQENPGGRVLGDLSREEARHQQTLKYQDDAKKFAEKEKQKAQKKKAEKWKRYSHVDVGQRLDSNEQEFENYLDPIRDQQQLTYDLQLAEGLEWERERENARARLADRRKEEKLKKYSHITSGQRLGPSDQTTGPCMERMMRTHQHSNSIHELQSAESIEHEQQNNLNVASKVEDQMTVAISQADRDNEHRQRMKLARERMQNKYNEELQKSS